jgi:prolyl oligopeptidase
MKTLLVSISALALAVTAALALPPVPATPAGSDFDMMQGVKIPDPYRWLETRSDPKVQAWSDAENTRTRAYLDALAGRDAVRSELTRMITATSPSTRQLVARGDLVFALYYDPKFQQPQLITMSAAADPASRKVLLDPNAMDAKGLMAIDWFVPSGDGTKVAVSLSQGGSENGTLHIYSVATGAEIDKPIPGVQFPTAGGSMAWAGDGKGFWYTRYPGADTASAERQFNMRSISTSSAATRPPIRWRWARPTAWSASPKCFLRTVSTATPSWRWSSAATAISGPSMC